jgi:uncharacterized RDD family membrane protein YckC
MTDGARGDWGPPWAARSASRPRRAVALIIDFGVGLLMLAGLMLAFTAIGTARRSEPPEERLDGVGIFVISILLTFLLYLVYEVGLVGLWGRTLGQLAVGIRVERLADGRRPGLPRSFLRNLIPTVTLVVFWPAFPVAWLVELLGRQGSPNDRLAGTRVVTSVRPHA